METNKRQHFISLFILSLLLSCSGEKKDSAQTETVSNKAIVRIETGTLQAAAWISVPTPMRSVYKVNLRMRIRWTIL